MGTLSEIDWTRRVRRSSRLGFAGIEEGLKAADVTFSEGTRHPTARDFVGLIVEGGGWSNDIATLGEQIDPLPFLAGDVQMGRQAEIQMWQTATGGAHGVGFKQSGIACLELEEAFLGVEVEDDQLADATGDDAQTAAAQELEPLAVVTGCGAVALEVRPRDSGGFGIPDQGDDGVPEVEISFGEGE